LLEPAREVIIDGSMKNLPRFVCSAVLIAALSVVGYAQQPRASDSVQASAQGHFELLTPQNSVLLLVDHQPQMAFGVQSHDRQAIKNNVQGLAKAAALFNVPTVLTTVAEKSFSGAIWPEIKAALPKNDIYDRTSMNAWDDKRVVQAIKATNRKKLIIAGLWTEVCVNMPTLEALKEGFEVYVVSDASGGTTKEAHEMTIARLVQAGAVPVTWAQVALEWQRDWARQETYGGITGIMREHAGAYGMGINYAHDMFQAKEAGQHK
jgi:nicotinamidase-related amidase